MTEGERTPGPDDFPGKQKWSDMSPQDRWACGVALSVGLSAALVVSAGLGVAKTHELGEGQRARNAKEAITIVLKSPAALENLGICARALARQARSLRGRAASPKPEEDRMPRPEAALYEKASTRVSSDVPCRSPGPSEPIMSVYLSSRHQEYVWPSMVVDRVFLDDAQWRAGLADANDR